MSEEWLEDDKAALVEENQFLKKQIASLKDFSLRIDNHLTDPHLYQVIVDEFLIHCNADRVVILVFHPERSNEIIVSQQACDPSIKSVPIPYFVENFEYSYIDFLKGSIQSGHTQTEQWNEPIMIHPEIFISRAMARKFQVDGEEGEWLICLEWVEGLPKWEVKVQALFENMIQYAQVVVDQRQMRIQIEDLQAQEQSLLASMPLPVIVLDLLGNITLWTGAAEEVFGLSLDEVLGVGLTQLFPELAEVDRYLPEMLHPGGRKIIDSIEFNGKNIRLGMFSLMDSGRGEVGLMVF